MQSIPYLCHPANLLHYPHVPHRFWCFAFIPFVAQGIRYSCDPAEDHLYPRLRLQYKPNLISMAGGMKGVPVTDPDARAEPVSPADWKRMLLEVQRGRTLTK